MSGRGRLRLSPAWSGGARPVGLADASRLTATVPPRACVTPPAIANAAAPRILGCHFVDPGRQRLSGGTDTWPRLLTGPKTPGLARGSTGRSRPTCKGLVCRIPDLAGRCCGVRGGGAQRDRVGQQVQDGQQLDDLLIGGGGGELRAEADLLAGHAGVEGQGGVDAVVQQEAAGPWQVVGGLRAAPR